MTRSKNKSHRPLKSVKPAKTDGKSGAATDTRTAPERLADSIRTSAQRETVEAFVVAFVLALLFRAFVAEAFVIPTGSMAPTLMGAHKDLECEQCQHRFQVGASKERRGAFEEATVVGGICPNCRFPNSLDLAENSNHATFNGDRILVSKFAYTISDPNRWDVIVFKFPGNPKQNYIKRLVGLPNETLSLYHGDVYVSETHGTDPETILRKPADTLLAMRHHVYDTGQQSELLINAGYPARLQPWRSGATQPPTDSWKIERSESGLVAKLDSPAGDQPEWLRYYHRWPSGLQWQTAAQGGPLDMIDPYSSRLITDFYAYDCYITVPSGMVYRSQPSNARMSNRPAFDPQYQSGSPLDQFGSRLRFGERGNANEGLHWVGDLIVETEFTTSEQCKQLTLELVESGIQYQCQIDLSSGKAALRIIDGPQQLNFNDAEGNAVSEVTGETRLRAGQSARVRFSNCDDQLLLWVDDELVQFAGPTVFDGRLFRNNETNAPRYLPGIHPLDAAPVGIAVQGGSATINQVKIDRDKYYVATNDSRLGINDYDMNLVRELVGMNVPMVDIQDLMARPDMWNQIPIWQTRRKVSFRLEDDQFFPMGDNSPESLDARCWAGAKLGARLPDRFHDQATAFAEASYVPRDLLVGRALLVFWPHPWNSPVPFTPNFDRFRLIR